MKMDYDVIILAAGLSSRMGKWKMTLPFGSKTMIEASVGNALEACRRVIIVGGYRIRELKEIFPERGDIDLIYNPQYEKGMFSSIKRGVSMVKSERFFVSLGDMPLVTADIYFELGRYREIDVVIPQYRGKKGHPVFLSERVGRRILQFSDDSTMREVLMEFLNLIVPVGSENILKDIDTEEDYRGVLEKKT